MKRNSLLLNLLIVTLLSMMCLSDALYAQLNVDGEFRVRWYGDSFSDTRDSRGPENYMRYDARIHAKSKIGDRALFSTEVVAVSDNPQVPTRNIAGTGLMRYGISELYGEISQPNFLVFDILRLRAGRQQFPLGNGLSLGESYNPSRFDGARIDLAKGNVSLSLFGAITGQNLSPSGLYPDPGSDQLYVARLGVALAQQDIMGYFIDQRPRGDFNDSYIIGTGSTGTLFIDKLEYFFEGAYQKNNIAPGLPQMSGIGYMGGLSYQWTLGPFKSIKLETRYAAYQGDDATTNEVERFSPMYPSFFWGARTGYVDGDIGGDYPHAGQSLEGSRIWYTRFWVIPRALPKVRIQFQYTKVDEYINNDGINIMDDEFAARIYYTFSSQVQLQFRYSRTIPNDGDYDFDGGGYVSSTEDRYSSITYMCELQIKF